VSGARGSFHTERRRKNASAVTEGTVDVRLDPRTARSVTCRGSIKGRFPRVVLVDRIRLRIVTSPPPSAQRPMPLPAIAR